LLVLALASASATPKAPAFGFCGNTAGSQCGGISPSGDVWEADESSCCPPQHMCVYKTMYYSECQPASHVPPSRTSTDAIAKRVLTEDAESVSDALDLFFLLINAQIVFFMQGGFAMLEVGIIQPKNAKSILFKNMLDMFVVALCWFMWGFGIAGNGGESLREAKEQSDSASARPLLRLSLSLSLSLSLLTPRSFVALSSKPRGL